MELQPQLTEEANEKRPKLFVWWCATIDIGLLASSAIFNYILHCGEHRFSRDVVVYQERQELWSTNLVDLSLDCSMTRRHEKGFFSIKISFLTPILWILLLDKSFLGLYTWKLLKLHLAHVSGDQSIQMLTTYLKRRWRIFFFIPVNPRLDSIGWSGEEENQIETVSDKRSNNFSAQTDLLVLHIKMTVRGTMVRSKVCNAWCFCLGSKSSIGISISWHLTFHDIWHFVTFDIS